MVADWVLFNSRSHFEAFSHELPRLINEQSPRDIVEDELRSCREILASKCAVLQPGLGLDALVVSPNRIGDDSNVFIDSNGSRVPVILWNARMEEGENDRYRHQKGIVIERHSSFNQVSPYASHRLYE